MWTDDLDVVESCDFYRSLLNFDLIDSISAYAATNTFAYVKAPSNRTPARKESRQIQQSISGLQNISFVIFIMA